MEKEKQFDFGRILLILEIGQFHKIQMDKALRLKDIFTAQMAIKVNLLLYIICLIYIINQILTNVIKFQKSF